MVRNLKAAFKRIKKSYLFLFIYLQKVQKFFCQVSESLYKLKLIYVVRLLIEIYIYRVCDDGNISTDWVMFLVLQLCSVEQNMWLFSCLLTVCVCRAEQVDSAGPEWGSFSASKQPTVVHSYTADICLHALFYSIRHISDELNKPYRKIVYRKSYGNLFKESWDITQFPTGSYFSAFSCGTVVASWAGTQGIWTSSLLLLCLWAAPLKQTVIDTFIGVNEKPRHDSLWWKCAATH